jgi:hypothetical protein
MSLDWDKCWQLQVLGLSWHEGDSLLLTLLHYFDLRLFQPFASFSNLCLPVATKLKRIYAG